MYKIAKISNKTIIKLNNGVIYERENLSDEDFNKLLEAKTDEEVISIINENYGNKIKEYNSLSNLMDRVSKSRYLSLRDDCIYWNAISPLTVPIELAERIIEAENSKDELRLTTYKNFWTLMSLNPDEDCRKNLFWFLTKWGLKISKHGFFVAYRNVENTGEIDTNGNPIYTDHYSGSTRIVIGEMVCLDRSKCDTDSNVTCSCGLHCAGAGWLDKNYYGNVGIVTLINPADVVAVPKESNYGKLRTCAYLPIKLVEYGKNGKVIPIEDEDGFDCSYVSKVIYEGLMGTESDSPYKIIMPDIPTYDIEMITDNILKIALDCITQKQVK